MFTVLYDTRRILKSQCKKLEPQAMSWSGNIHLFIRVNIGKWLSCYDCICPYWTIMLFTCPYPLCSFQDITKTYLYNFDPLKPHFYIVKLGFTGVYIIFLISAQNVDCGYSLEPPRRGGSNEYPQSMFWAEIWKISEFFIWKFSVFGDEIFYILE